MWPGPRRRTASGLHSDWKPKADWVWTACALGSKGGLCPDFARAGNQGRAASGLRAGWKPQADCDRTARGLETRGGLLLDCSRTGKHRQTAFGLRAGWKPAADRVWSMCRPLKSKGAGQGARLWKAKDAAPRKAKGYVCGLRAGWKPEVGCAQGIRGGLHLDCVRAGKRRLTASGPRVRWKAKAGFV